MFTLCYTRAGAALVAITVLALTAAMRADEGHKVVSYGNPATNEWRETNWSSSSSSPQSASSSSDWNHGSGANGNPTGSQGSPMDTVTRLDNLAKRAISEGDFALAARYYKQASDINPFLYGGQWVLAEAKASNKDGLAALNQRNYQLAVVKFREALTHCGEFRISAVFLASDPMEPTVRRNLRTAEAYLSLLQGGAAAESGDWKAAVRFYKDASKRLPEEPMITAVEKGAESNLENTLGRTAYDKGDFKGAERHFHAALAVLPPIPQYEPRRQTILSNLTAVQAAKEGKAVRGGIAILTPVRWDMEKKQLTIANTKPAPDGTTPTALQQLRDAKGHGDKSRTAALDAAKAHSNRVFDTRGDHNGEQDPAVPRATGSPVVPESIRRRPDYVQINDRIIGEQRAYYDLETKLQENKAARERSSAKKETDKLVLERAETINKMARLKSQIGVDQIKREKIINLAAAPLEEEKPKRPEVTQADKPGASSRR
jgi:tetratricopeptide (TPR) repeat protein